MIFAGDIRSQAPLHVHLITFYMHASMEAQPRQALTMEVCAFVYRAPEVYGHVECPRFRGWQYH